MIVYFIMIMCIILCVNEQNQNCLKFTFFNKVNDQMSNEANKYSPVRSQSHIDIWIAFSYKKLITFF